MAYRANDRRGSKIVVADEGGTSQPPEEQRLVSHDLSVRWLVRRQAQTSVFTHPKKSGDVNPAYACQSLMHLWFSVVAFRRADAVLAPRIRFLLLLFTRLATFLSFFPQLRLVLTFFVFHQPRLERFACSFTSDLLAHGPFSSFRLCSAAPFLTTATIRHVQTRKEIFCRHCALSPTFLRRYRFCIAILWWF